MNSPYSSLRHEIAYFCGTIELNKDGVTKVLSEINHYNHERTIPSLFVTPVADEQTIMRYIKVPGIPVPIYSGYKLSIASSCSIQSSLRSNHFHPSIIHLHSPCTLGRAGQKIAARLGIPCVATYHTHFPSYLQYHGFPKLEQPLRSFLSRFYNRCDATIVPSKSLYQELKAMG
jgi:phosphatidylinositol alpha 1,6-mannosyltransferase